jgi:hypothetical protein
MIKPPKPIKRSPQLAHLSREHHETLLFSWKLRQGLGNNTSSKELRDFTLWYWRNFMKPHFEQEEKILLPYLSGHYYEAQLKKEHDDIRDLVLTLDIHPERTLFSILSSFVDNHVRFEERHVFGYLENSLTPDQLDKVAEELLSQPSCSSDWKNPFWEK